MGAGESKLASAVERGNLNGVREALKAGEDADCNNKGAYTPLHKAAEAGYHNIAVALVEAKANIHAKDKRHQTLKYEPLHFAAENGHKDIALMLICAGASLSSKTALGDQALHLALKRNHHNIVSILINAGADVSTPNASGKPPLHMAIEEGNVQIAQSLVDAKANVLTKDENGNNVIHLAVQNNRLPIISALISSGADILAKNDIGQTSLHIATENGNVQIVQALVNAGADISAKNENGFQVHHVAAATGQTKIMDILLSAGADFDDFTSEGNQALHIAAENGCHTIVASLVSAGADITTPNHEGKNAAHIAAANGHTEVLKILKKHGDDFAAFSNNTNKSTPLHYAAENGHMNTVQWLVRNGASMKTYNSSRMTPVDVAKINFHHRITSWFDQVKEQHKNVLEYAKRGDFHSVISALDVGASASSELLHLAILAGKVRVVQAALSLGIGVENSSVLFRYRPLHHAAERGHAHVVQELLKAGADHTAMEYRGRAAIHIAASFGHEKVLKVMKTHGCNINLKSSNRYKWMPLHYAVWEGQLSAVKWLVQNGADLSAKDGYGNTPLNCATNRKHNDVIQYLQFGATPQPNIDEGSCGSSEDEGDCRTNKKTSKPSEKTRPSKTKSMWSNQEVGETEIPEICYKSTEGTCSNEIKGCQRLHSNRLYHWQVKEPFGVWLNLPEKQVNCLEYAFCDPYKDGISLPMLSEDAADFIPVTLSDIMVRDSWRSDFKNMTLTDPQGRRVLKLRRLCSEKVDGKQLKPSMYAWYFLDKNKKWVMYGNVDSSGDKKLACNITSSDIEKLFNENQSQSIYFKNSEYMYILDFATMTQRNQSTDAVREVRRRPLPHRVNQDQSSKKFSLDNLGHPDHWEVMESNEHLRKVELFPNSKEYEDICELLRDAINIHSVEKIERIQNPFLWFAFQNKVREMTTVYGNIYEVNVSQLFHGTNPHVIDKICSENFDWRLHGTNVGQVYGRGTYFSPNAKTAYAYCKSDSYGRHYLFLAQVAVGTCTIGNANLVTPPINPNTKRMFDSTVDSLGSPNIIVKYDKQEYYPEYIVTINNNPLTRRNNVNANANCVIS